MRVFGVGKGFWLDRNSRRFFLKKGFMGSLLSLLGGASLEAASAAPEERAQAASSLPWTIEELQSRLGIFTHVDYFNTCSLTMLPRELYAYLEEIKAAGIPYLSVGDFPKTGRRDDKTYAPFRFSDQDSVRRFARACRNVGLKIYDFHSAQGSDPLLLTETDGAKREIDLLEELGGKIWLTHASSGKGLYENQRALEQLVRYCEGRDIRITVENLKPLSSGPPHDWTDVLKVVDAIDHPQLGLTVDVGHCTEPYIRESREKGQHPMLQPGRPTEIFRAVAHRLNHLHLHDFCYDPVSSKWFDHQPPFAGNMRWVEIFKVLAEIRYQGVFNFETTALYRGEAIKSVGLFPELLMQAATLPHIG